MKEFLAKTFLALLAVLAPVGPMMITALVLILADLVTGVMASLKKKKPITSAGIRRTVSKVFVYELAILMAFLAQTYMTGETVPVCNIVTGLIGMTEFLSILENLNTISGKKLLKAVIDKVGSENK
jgi:phage-related holin